jgi:hypothetical protein
MLKHFFSGFDMKKRLFSTEYSQVQSFLPLPQDSKANLDIAQYMPLFCGTGSLNVFMGLAQNCVYL